MAKSCSLALRYSKADASTLFFKKRVSTKFTYQIKRRSYSLLTSQGAPQIFQWKEPNSPVQDKINYVSLIKT